MRIHLHAGERGMQEKALGTLSGPKSGTKWDLGVKPLPSFCFGMETACPHPLPPS